MKTAECGTETAYRYHYERGEKPCDMCRASRSLRRRDDYVDRRSMYRVQARASYDRNREKAIADAKEYHRKNPDVMQRAKNRRRAAKRASAFGRYTKDQVLELYGTVCHICDEQIDLSAKRHPGDEGWERGLHIDHVIPIRMGGPDTIENVRPSHGLCNLRKGLSDVRK